MFIFGSLQELIGEQRFLAKMHTFLEHNKHLAVELSDFVGFLANVRVDGWKSAATFLHFWFETPGYPSLEVSRDYRTRQVRIRQRQIFPKGAGSSRVRTSSYRTLNNTWPIPLKVRLQNNASWQVPYRLFQAKLDRLGTVPLTEHQWLLFNPGFIHFYRVNYDLHNWKLLTNQLSTNADVFDAATRAQIVSDFCFFYRLGLIDNGQSVRWTLLNVVNQQRHKYPHYRRYALNCG